MKILGFKKVACPLFLFFFIFLLQTTVMAQMTGTTYKTKDGVVNLGGGKVTTTTQQLEFIMGVYSLLTMQGGAYALNPGFYKLNNLPVATISSYNDSQPTQDQTPTLVWAYSDADNDSQKRYQLQVGREDFGTIVVDTGMVGSDDISYTTPLLPLSEERVGYKWRVRVNDGFGWSGWAQANSGFYLTTGGFLITGLGALTVAGGEEIAESTWQKDNDPYFYWEAPALGLEVLGYSYSLDTSADEVVDTTNTYYSYPQDSITDGNHSFYVKAQRSSGLWGEPANFNIWVDTTAPSVQNMLPAFGAVLSTDQPQVGALLSDIASGVSPTAIEMKINQAQVTPEYNAETNLISYTPAIPLSDGEITVSLKAGDVVGNLSLPLTWSFVIDTEGPVGSLVINNGDEMTTANIVTLNISAEDEISNISEMILSNDGVFDTETWEPYTTLRKNWVLPAITGMCKVYAQVKDEAGNISEAFFDDINLVIFAPDTYILSGPAGITQLTSVQFTFRSSLSACQFSYKFDNEEWSPWSGNASVSKANLSEGNHYFMVKSAKDLNQDRLFQIDEVDPTPALRVWTISVTGVLKPPAQPEKPVKYWEEE